jgi:hypothetical protein
VNNPGDQTGKVVTRYRCRSPPPTRRVRR